MSTSSIRTQLLRLVLAVSIPLVATVGFGIYSDMQQSIAHTKTTLRTLASTMVSNTGGKIADARHVLERLAVRPLIGQVDAKNCDAALSDLHNLNPNYANIGYADMEGLVVCSAVPRPGGKPVNIGKTPWFQKLLKERGFTVGQPFFGPFTGKWVSVLSTPIWNARREMVGAVLLPLDLATIDPQLPAQLLTADSRYGFFSEDGIMIWRNLDPEVLIGTRPNSDAARRIVEVRDGEFESRASDGVVRFFSVVPMPETGWIAFVGVPASEIYAAAKRRAITVTSIVLAAMALMVLFAIAIARRIARPVMDLERAARAVHSGDIGVRAVVDGPREIAAVAQEFNAMIDARQRSDAQLRIAATAFESQEGMVVTDADGVILRINRAFTETTGYTAEEAVGQTHRLLQSGRHNAGFYRAMWETIKRTGGWQGEIWDRRKNGEENPKWLTISAVRDDHGVVTHYVATHFDITVRKRAKLALAAAQRRTAVLAQLGRQLAEAVTAKAAAIHILEAAQQLLRWDSGWLHLSDEQQKNNKVDLVSFDLIDGEIREVFPDMSGVATPTHIARQVKEEGPQLVLRDSESEASADTPAYGSGRRSLSLMFVPIRLSGTFIGIFSIQSYQRHAYDHADLELLQSLATHCAGALVRLQSVDALRESEARFRSLTEMSTDFYWESDVEHRLTQRSESKREAADPSFRGVSSIGKRRWEISYLSPDESGWQKHRAMLDAHLPFREFEILRNRTNGAEHYICVSGDPVFNAAGEFKGYRGIGTDITERKQAEAVRASLEARLRESQKMEAIGTLAGGIAHDFNNIIATILGNAELARQDMNANPQALESLDEIRKAGSRARDLVQQILSFSRRQPTEKKPTALASVIDESVRLLRATLPARITLEVHCDAAVPTVCADANQIQQILINLVTNAMQAMPGGPGYIGIRLDTVMLDAAMAQAHPALRALHDKHPGRTLRLAVSDNGPGMDAATLERIFEPFFTTKPVDEGTGLGLAVVHGIVETHEGEIEVASQPGRGTTFTIYLPVAAAEANAMVPDERAAATALPSRATGGHHILYLDDDESLVFLVTRLLERRGFRISGFIDQQKALAAVRADPAGFDLVVTDYNMPGMSGLDVARAVRSIRPDLVVAVASGFIDETLRAKAYEAGVRELIFKANAVEELSEAFARLAQTVGEKAKGG